MGREIKRVALDFTFPLGETWTGYLCPHHRPNCKTCAGRGTTASYQAFEQIVSLLMLAGAESAQQRGRLHPYFDSTPVRDVGTTLGDLSGGLAGRHPRTSFIGHDACDNWAAVRKIQKAAGLPKKWGHCPTCKGRGYPLDRALAARINFWKPTEPPAGEGWQLWQTVSEGGPVSPVFASPEGLARWLAAPGNDTSITRGRSVAQWLAFIVGPGWAPSMISDGTKLMSGVEAITPEAIA